MVNDPNEGSKFLALCVLLKLTFFNLKKEEEERIEEIKEEKI